MDENKKETLEINGKVKSPSVPKSPTKSLGVDEDADCVPELHSPCRHVKDGNDEKSFQRNFIGRLSGRKKKGKTSIKDKASKMDESKKETETLETNETMESPSKPGSPVKSLKDENVDCVSELSSPPQKDENENEGKGPQQGLMRRISKHFSMKNFQKKESNFAGDAADSSLDNENGDPIRREPLSVMQIYELIEKRQLLEAFANIMGLEDELLAEKDVKKYEDSPKEYFRKARDVDLLYTSVSKMITSIVEESLDRPSIDVLKSLGTLIDEEEKAHAGAKATEPPEPDGLGTARQWRELWKEAVTESVRGRVLKVPVPLRDDNSSWLAIHLGYLRKCIGEDLLKIKGSVKKCYPDNYKVCDVYVESFHGAISSHLQSILQQSLEFNELYAVLDWVAHIYLGELFLGHPELKPEVKLENLPPLLPTEVWNKLKNDYLNSTKGKIKCCLDNILKLERIQMWEREEEPEDLQDTYCSSLSFDIQTLIGEHTMASGKISKSLEASTLEISIKELKEFIPRFGKAFLEWGKVKDHPLFLPYLVSYINTFHNLRMGLQSKFNINCPELNKILTDLTQSCKNNFLNKLKPKTQPMFKKILTEALIVNSGTMDCAIMTILSIIKQFSQHLQHLDQPSNQDFINEVHRYVVKEYITEAIKPRRMRRRKQEELSQKMNQEATMIHETFTELGSDAAWLAPAIPYIANIIGERKKQKIKDQVKDMWENYPDVRKEHIAAILSLCGLWRHKRQSILQQLSRPKDREEMGHDRELFAMIEAPTIVSCF
uniref:Exocyst complex component 3 like 4 n=1 Tax=Sphenodon punctatus TaxID=8508 RepID=A0A8D0GXJ0_SPHPU